MFWCFLLSKFDAGVRIMVLMLVLLVLLMPVFWWQRCLAADHTAAEHTASAADRAAAEHAATASAC